MAEINLAHVRHNARVLQAQAGPAPLMGVVKADAYGHGAVRVAQVLREEGVRHFGVATVPEGIALREAGIEEAVLVFAAPLPHHLPAYAAHRLDVTVSSSSVADAVVAASREHGPIRAQLKVDTGLGRIGVPPGEAADVARRLRAAPDVTLAGIWTHFATAEEEGDAFAAEQLARFRTSLAPLADLLRENPDVHLHAASSGPLRTLRDSYTTFEPTLVRTGIGLYGLASEAAMVDAAGLRPVMRLLSHVTHLKTVEAGTTISYDRTWRASRPTRIATVGIGYADGYPRRLSNRGEVGLRGRRYGVAGLVCMDMLMVDLGDPAGPGADVRVGDAVVLFGAGGPSAFEVAERVGTIPYEICCGVAARVPRRYTDV